MTSKTKPPVQQSTDSKLNMPGLTTLFQPPPPFDFKQPDQWDRWIKRFERYMSVSGLADKPEEQRVITLIYCLGDEAEDVLTTAQLSDQDQKSYKKVKKAFEAVFIGKRNVIYERAKFNSRNQKPGELFDIFLADISSMAQHCEYGTLRDELIRDRIVVGINNSTLSAQLQEDAELTLEKAILKCRQKESVGKQMAEIQQLNKSSAPASIDRIQRSKPGKPKRVFQDSNRQSSSKSKLEDKSSNDQNNCWNCGNPKHSRSDCPAKDVKCNLCKRIGHFAKMCKSSRSSNNKQHKAGKVQSVDANDNVAFLGQLASEPRSDCRNKKLYVDVLIDNHTVNVRMDCGADVTAVPDTIPEFRNRKLKPPDRVLKDASKKVMNVRGMFETNVIYENRVARDKVYVVSGLAEPLLGSDALLQLDLIRLNLASANRVSSEDISKRYPQLFSGLGEIPAEYKIELAEGTTPYSVSCPRNIPLPLYDKVKRKLERMEALEIIEKIDEPTDWCSPIVPVSKDNGDVRICVDLSKLNKSVKREKIILPAVDETLAKIKSAKIFSKLDAESGFWQIKLERESAKLTTFITPFGRYFFKRLPFGITSAPEFFQKVMFKLLEGIDGVVCHMDDILVYGVTQQEHDQRLHKVLQRLLEAKVVLNPEKCEFSRQEIKFLGQIIDQKGVNIDPDRISALENLPPPADVGAVRRVLGMLNQLAKFIPHLAGKTEPIRALLKKNIQFRWTSTHQSTLEKIIAEVKKVVSLAYYDVNAEYSLMADASSYGLGAVLLQKNQSGMVPVMFASRSLSDAEKRYAQIEKEALATTWACEKFSKFLIGKEFEILTDHKPLVPLLGVKDLCNIPVRIQRFKMRLMKFNYSIKHIPGKEMFTADTLSRAPASNEKYHFTDEVEAHVRAIISFPASFNRLEEIRHAQLECDECQQLEKLIISGWPEHKKDVPEIVKQWHMFRNELVLIENLICRNNRIIIPKALRPEILKRLHEGHFGITRTLQRASNSVFWPGITTDIKNLVEGCEECIKYRPPKVLEMIPSDTPDRPWQKIGVDVFEFEKKLYLAIVDYYSRFPEILNMNSMTTSEIIQKIKPCFARYGIPEIVVSDSGTQFLSQEWKDLAKHLGFKIVTSSPHYHQSNGEVERTIKWVKSMLKKSDDPVMALLNYRCTPNHSGKSPAELLMGRKLRNRLPELNQHLVPQVIDHDDFRQWDTQFRDNQKQNYDSRHRAMQDFEFTPGTEVYVPDKESRGVIVEKVAPRSYSVRTEDSADYRRNGVMLRSGRISQRPVKLDL